ncbi:MAG: STAS/SEC14 domain-containing protein [Nitrosospira sp.]|jgi:hypothetical protein
MLKIIEGLPPDVLGIEAVGTVTHDDYRSILIPKAEAMLARGSIKMLYVVGDQFTKFELEALWDDGEFGIRHWREFSHVAVVTDIDWLRSMAAMFAPLIPADFRLFRLSEMQAAKNWITANKAAV